MHTLLSAGLLNLLGQANTDQAVVGLELLHGLGGVVDKSEAGGLATTELGAQTKDGDLVLAGLVQASELLAELILGDVGTVGVQDVTIMEQKQVRKRARTKSVSCCAMLCAGGAPPKAQNSVSFEKWTIWNRPASSSWMR